MTKIAFNLFLGEIKKGSLRHYGLRILAGSYGWSNSPWSPVRNRPRLGHPGKHRENIDNTFLVFAVLSSFILSVVRADTNDAELEQELDQYLNNLADEIIAEEQFQRDARAAGNR